MQKQSLQDMAEQSDAAFRDQFDPNSKEFHGGSQIPVPLNGERIPETMQSMYPEGYDPNKPVEVIDYGEEYRNVQASRSTYLQLKKSLAKLCPVVESFLRHEQNFKEKGDTSNENHIKVYNENVQKENQNLKNVILELQTYYPRLEAIGEQGKGYAKELKQVIEDSKKKYENKETLTNFNFNVKKLSTQTFASANKCLQKLKDIKKEHGKKVKKDEPAQ